MVKSGYTGGGGTTVSGLRRIGFQLKFTQNKLKKYLKDHEKVWPEMQKALMASGWHNYSLFYRPDGLAFGYFETDAASFAEACGRMECTEVNAKWQAAMAKYTPAKSSPIDAAQELSHYFYLGKDRTFKPTAPKPPKRSAPSSFTGGGGTTRNGLRRIGFQMKFAKEKLKSYLKDHETVWPEQLKALTAAGWRNFSLFCRKDGLAFGYMETEASSFAEACARLDRSDANQRWQKKMAKYTPAQTGPLDAAQELTHYFYLGGDRLLDSTRRKRGAVAKHATKRSAAVLKKPVKRKG